MYGEATWSMFDGQSEVERTKWLALYQKIAIYFHDQILFNTTINHYKTWCSMKWSMKPTLPVLCKYDLSITLQITG